MKKISERMKKTGRKGFIYTLSAILLSISLVMLIVYYYGLIETGTGTTRLGETKIEETEMTGITSKIRCDELHYFVEDIKMSMSRGLLIGGRRAAIYVIDKVVQNGTPIPSDYKMNTVNCPFAESINTSLRGSEAAIAELLVCGTYNGKSSEFMLGHTLSAWRDKMMNKSDRSGLKLDMSFGDVDIIPYDAWHFVVVTKTNFNASDRANICHFSGYNTTIISISSIIDLEDPLYPLKTSSKVYKYIKPCDEPEYINKTKIGIGKLGAHGNAGGIALFLDKINCDNYTTDTDKIECCAKDMTKCVDGVYNPKKVVLVIDNNSDVLNYVCDSAYTSLKGNLSLYGGLIDFNCGNASYNLTCLNIPYVIGTGDLIGNATSPCPKTGCGNCTDYGAVSIYPCNESCSWVDGRAICNDTGNKTQIDCTDCSFGGSNCLSNYDCVFLTNNGSEHSVGRGISCGDIDRSCYYVSNSTKYITSCSNNYPDGPSFFDRLEGSLNLSQRYADKQSSFCDTSCNDSNVEWFGKDRYCLGCNSTDIGLESFVNLQEFYDRDLFGQTLRSYKNETWVDYLYFLNQNSTVASYPVDTCSCPDIFNFNIDCQHAYRYEIKKAAPSCP